MIGMIISDMIQYFDGDIRRVNHFLKVYGYAKAIGEMEGLNKKEQYILEIAALTHDIGIKNSEIKYHSTAGKYQQIEGPPEANKLLKNLCTDEMIIERVCWLIAHHHIYTNITGNDYQILVEADFLVNAFEDNMTYLAIQTAKEKIFRTTAGKKYLEDLYHSFNKHSFSRLTDNILKEF